MAAVRLRIGYGHHHIDIMIGPLAKNLPGQHLTHTHAGLLHEDIFNDRVSGRAK